MKKNGSRWINDGLINKKLAAGNELPAGYVYGRLKDSSWTTFKPKLHGNKNGTNPEKRRQTMLSRYGSLSPMIYRPESIQKMRKTRKKQMEESRRLDLLTKPFEMLHKSHRYTIIKTEQNGKCNICFLSEWNGKPLLLEIDHIDGDISNNRRENLRGICPNCHSQTPTWRGRNIKRNRVPDEIIKQLIDLGFNNRQILLKIGYSPRGANYKKIDKLR